MSDLPPGWAWAELSQICTSITDGDHQPPPQASTGIPFLVIGNIRNHRLNLSGCRYVSEEYYHSLKSIRRPQKGDVLYSLVGSYGIPALVRDDDPFCVQRHIGILRPSPGVSAPFLAHLLSSLYFYDQATNCATGTAQLTVPLTGLRRIRVPVPPRDEQDEIVAVIEEQFSCIDAAVTALRSAQKRAISIKKAILLTAVPEVWPGRWDKVKVAEAGEVALGRQRAPQYHNGPKMRPYLRVANVFEDRIDSGDVMSMHFDDEEFERFRLRPEDILLNEGQSPHLLGRPAMYRGDPPDVAFTNSLLRFRAGPDVLPAWALLVFRRHMHAKRFMDESQITTNIAHLSAGRFKKVDFPIPPMDEQKLIVATVEEELSEVSRMEAMVNTQLTRADRLRSSILAAAFSGQLVSRDKAAA